METGGHSSDLTPDLPSFAAFVVKTPFEGKQDVRAFPDEMESLGSRAVRARQDRFVRGRLAAHEAIRELGGRPSPIKAGPMREPIWPGAYVGSISHVSEFSVALVADSKECKGVGVDVEELARSSEIESFVTRPEEASWLDNAVASSSRQDWLVALFSAKESLYKAFYPLVGRFFGFDAASLAPSGSGLKATFVSPYHEIGLPTQTEFHVEVRWTPLHVLTWLLLPMHEDSQPWR